jgi:asparagine N-glycosylation enzyme membrane subunit Stt3
VAAIWSCFGHADHHVAEALTLLAFLAAFVRAVLRTGREALYWTLFSAFLLTGTMMTWQGAVFAVALAVPCALLLAPANAAILGVATLAFTSLGTWLSLRGETVPFSFISFGWFQPLLVACAAVALCLWAGWRMPNGKGRVLSLLAALGLMAILAPNVERLAGAILRGGAFLAASQIGPPGDDFADGGYLSYPSDFLAVVAEAKPLLQKPLWPSFRRAVSELNPGLLVLPLALLFWAVLGIKRSVPRIRGRWILVVYGSALFLMAFGQRRNVYYLAIFTAAALAEVIARLETRLPSWRKTTGVLVAAILVLATGWDSLRRVWTYSEVPGRDLFWTMEKLRELDPPGQAPWQEPRPKPGEMPGVFCPWSMGHFVTALVQRPAAADPNTYGWRRQCRLYSSPTDQEAWEILKATKVRYLITMNLRPVLKEYARAAGREERLTPEEMFGIRIHESLSRNPAPFLELFLDSRTAYRTRDGRLIPAYRVWKVIEPPGS